MADIENIRGLETSADMEMPLPLTQEGVQQLPSESLTEEVVNSSINRMYPGIQLPNNVNIAVIPGDYIVQLYSLFPCRPCTGGD